MATKQQRKFGGLPYRKPKRKLTPCELETGMTAEQLRAKQLAMKAAAMKRFLGGKAA